MDMLEKCIMDREGKSSNLLVGAFENEKEYLPLFKNE